jgi:hypothetical protein
MWMTSASAPRFDAGARERRRALLVLVCLLGLFSAARVRAQQADLIDLEWTAPPECPRLVEVQARIRKLAGSLKPSATPLRAEATVTRNDDGGLHLRLAIHAGKLVGERNIDGKSCRDLASATAVNLVLLLNSPVPLAQNDLAWHTAPNAETPHDGSSHDDSVHNDAAHNSDAGGDSANKPSAAADSPTIPPKPASVAPEAQPTPAHAEHSESGPPRRWHVLLQLPLFALGIGPLRVPEPGIAAAGGVSFDRWRILAKGTAWFPRQASVTANFQQYGGDIDRATGTLQVCRALVSSPLEIAPCALVSLEHVSARGTGAHVAAHTAAATFLAAGLGVQARVYVTSWLSLNAGVDAQLETSTPQISIDGVGPVEELLPAAATGTLGSEWMF